MQKDIYDDMMNCVAKGWPHYRETVQPLVCGEEDVPEEQAQPTVKAPPFRRRSQKEKLMLMKRYSYF